MINLLITITSSFPAGSPQLFCYCSWCCCHFLFPFIQGYFQEVPPSQDQLTLLQLSANVIGWVDSAACSPHNRMTLKSSGDLRSTSHAKLSPTDILTSWIHAGKWELMYIKAPQVMIHSRAWERQLCEQFRLFLGWTANAPCP